MKTYASTAKAAAVGGLQDLLAHENHNGGVGKDGSSIARAKREEIALRTDVAAGV
jgi:hypothetical protein